LVLKIESYNSQSNPGHKYNEQGKGRAVLALRSGKPSTELPKNEASQQTLYEEARDAWS
jgi:hypothetical protein